jgi:hypothetical protein
MDPSNDLSRFQETSLDIETSAGYLDIKTSEGGPMTKTTATQTIKIAVFGASGDVGRRMVAEAARRGHRVTAVARREPSPGMHDPAVAALDEAEHPNHTGCRFTVGTENQRNTPC